MRIFTGILALVCFLLLSLKYPLRKLGLHRLNAALMKFHEHASAGLLLAGLIHLILCIHRIKVQGALLIFSGISVFVMSIVIIAACHMMKEPAQKMRWHRVLSLAAALLLALHIAAFWL